MSDVVYYLRRNGLIKIGWTGVVADALGVVGDEDAPGFALPALLTARLDALLPGHPAERQLA